MYFRNVCDVLGLDKDILHKANFVIFIGIAFYLLFAQAFVNGFFFIVANYLLMAVASAYLLIWFFRKWRSRTDLRLKSRHVWASLVGIAILILIMGIIVFQRFMIVQGQYGTTMGDGVQHSYIVNRILETGIYQTASDLKVSYIFGSHTIASLSAFLLGEPTYQIALLSTVLFSFLNFFAFYSLASTLNLRKTYRYFVAIILTFFLHTSFTAICWGGLSSGTALYLLVCTIAFSTKIFSEQATRNKKKFFLFSILLFGPLLVTYPPYMIFIVFWLLLYPLFSSLSTRDLLGRVKRNLLLFPALAVTSASFIGYLIPTISTILAGLSSRVEALPAWVVEQPTGVNWAFEYNNMFSPTAFLDFKQFTEYLNLSFFTHVQGFFDLVFYGVIFSILVIGLSHLAKRDNHGSIQRIARLILLTYGFLVVVWAFNNLSFNYGFLEAFFPPQRILVATGIFVAIQYVLTIFLVVELTIAAIGPLLSERRSIVSSILSRLGFTNFSVILSHFIVAVILFMLLLSNLGVAITETTNSQQWIDSNSSVTLDDFTLQQWMTGHLPSNSTVLIQWSDGGQYVPLVTDFKTIYPFGLPPSFQEHSVYTQVLQNLSKDADDPIVRQSLEILGVDYVYIGSNEYTKALSPYFNARSLAYSPFFQLVHRIGNASLFKFLREPSIEYFFDDFENTTHSVEVWYPVQGDWMIENGTYRQTNTSISEKPMLSIVGTRNWTNYVVKSRVKIVSEGEDHQQAGLVFGYQDEDNYYYLRTRNLNQLRFGTRYDGHFETLEMKSWAGKIDEWYMIMIIVEGPRIQVLLNGEKLFDVVDTTFAQGHVGLWAWYTNAAFDRVIVLSLEERGNS